MFMKKFLLFAVTLAALSQFASAGTAKPYLLTPKTTFDTQPTLSRAKDGSVWAGWVAYSHPDGDAIMTAHQVNGAWSAPEQVNAVRGQIVRPTICVAGDVVWFFWTETGDNLANIMA